MDKLLLYLTIFCVATNSLAQDSITKPHNMNKLEFIELLKKNSPDNYIEYITRDLKTRTKIKYFSFKHIPLIIRTDINENNITVFSNGKSLLMDLDKKSFKKFNHPLFNN